MLRNALILMVCILGRALMAAPPAPNAATPPPPATFQDEAGTRFLTVEWLDEGKVKLALRTAGSPGQYGHWAGNGEQTDKGIVFAQTVEEGDRGAFYLATGGQGRLVVKLKPGQTGMQDGGLVGTYHHITDEKLAGLLKKDSELAEKKIEESLRTASKHLAAEDRPALAEWKKRWPELRNRLHALAGTSKPKPGAAATPPPAPTKPAPPGVGQPATTPSAKDQAAYYMTLAETSGTAAAFIAQPLPPGIKAGWEGVYEDGFGGSIDIQRLKSGRIKFILNTNRGTSNGMMEESIPPEAVKDNPNGTEGTADFKDNNEEVKDPTQQAKVHLHRIGHYIIVETEYAERYANRAWFDGVYAKRPTPPAAD